jgi:hypothetical protein
MYIYIYICIYICIYIHKLYPEAYTQIVLIIMSGKVMFKPKKSNLHE